jgi:prephenate dehydrogenase
LTGQVHIIGSGLLGTSIALALKQQGVDVSVEDISPGNQALAIDFGGFRKIGENDEPSLVVVCVPPDVTAATVKQALERFEAATVTDVASIKVAILEELLALGLDLSRYVGSHPMAGRERGGALSGQADLFVGRPFIICASQNARSESVSLVEALALDLGASPVRLSPSEHDNAVALVSHLPQLVA